MAQALAAQNQAYGQKFGEHSLNANIGLQNA
jgi:hypothetical protein